MGTIHPDRDACPEFSGSCAPRVNIKCIFYNFNCRSVVGTISLFCMADISKDAVMYFHCNLFL